MTLGKKKLRDKYISKGIVGTTKSRSRNDSDAKARRLRNQQEAWQQGKNVVLTVENPNKNETNRRFIKVNAREVWGNPKRKVG